MWKNHGSDPDAIWHHSSAGSRHEADGGVWGLVHGKGYFVDKFGACHCNHWGLYGVRVDLAAIRPSSQITFGRLVIVIIFLLSQCVMVLVFVSLRYGLCLV